MKKKLLIAVLSVFAAIAMTACGGNTDTAEVKETTVMEESAESDAQAEAETKAQEEAKAEAEAKAQEEAEAKAQEEAEAKAQAEAEEQARLAEANEYYEAGRKSLYGLDGAQIDIEDAYTNFTKAQELGNIDANFYLGVLTDRYYNYPKLDYGQAKAYYEQSGDNPYAQIALGYLYRYVEYDGEKGNELFQAAVDQGIIEGYYGLAIVAEVETDFETALEYYNKVVEEGTEQFYITQAMSCLGTLYVYGNGVEQDIAKAIEWYTKAADLGNTGAMSWLGYLYMTGSGVEQDSTKAIEWYTKAADLNNASAMTWLGSIYAQGNGVEQDGAKAVEWYTKAADLGDTAAMYDLGAMYESGNGVEQDDAKANEWYTKVAELSVSSAE